MDVLFNFRHQLSGFEQIIPFCTFTTNSSIQMAKKEGKILVVDDNENILRSLTQLLKFDFESVRTVSNPNLIPTLVRTGDFDVILLDMNFSAGIMTGNEGIYWLREILNIDPLGVVILITAYGDIKLAVKAIREGGTDFITKPWDANKLIVTLKSAIKLRKSKLEVSRLRKKQEVLKEDLSKQMDPIIGNSPAIRKVLETVKKVAVTDANVLILGENGTGKELVAREIHRQSLRSNESFVSVDMAAITETLFESEMFGHEKGAFTDAHDERTGRFEIASGGTLFLDEIGNLSMHLQTKLLKALQDREITRVGAETSVAIDIRLITATNKNLNEMVTLNTFREDLLYRINTIQVQLPALRERKEDIPVLADYFLKKYQHKYAKAPVIMKGDAYDKLLSHSWPGNIRELKHTMEKAVILCESGTLGSEDFFFGSASMTKTSSADSMKLAVVEKNLIEKALRECHGNMSKAAKILDISRTTLYSKIKKYGL